MATIIGIGFSDHTDPSQAFKEAAIEAKGQINLPSVDLAIIFITNGYATQDAIETLHRILQPIRMVGATAPALIIRGRTETRGVGVLAICSEEIKFGTTMLDHLSFMNFRDAGLKVARDSTSDCASTNRQGFLTLMNSTHANHSPLLQGLQEAVGTAFSFAGGICCDNKLERGFMLHKSSISSDGIISVLWGGTIPTVVAARHGWKPLGKPRTIDDAENNLIKIIDRRPAVSLYYDYFPAELKNFENGDLGTIGLLYPLGINTDRPKEYILRHPIKALPDGSMVCQAEIPIGSRVHIMINDKDECRLAAHEAALDIRDQLFGRIPKLIIILESLARHKLLGRGSNQEFNIIKDTLGLTVPIFGMYTYGEIAPLGSSKENRTAQIQNATIVIMAIG